MTVATKTKKTSSEQFSSILTFIKSFGAASAVVIGAVVWIGKPYAEEFVRDTTKEEIQVIKDVQDTIKRSQYEMKESIEKLTNILLVSLSSKQRDALVELKKDKEILMRGGK